MSRRRKLHEASTKARVALEAVKERETVAQIARRFGVHPTQVNQWKRKLLQEASGLFDRENGSRRSEALFPRKSTSAPGAGHRVYPYLLRGLSIDRRSSA